MKQDLLLPDLIKDNYRASGKALIQMLELYFNGGHFIVKDKSNPRTKCASMFTGVE